MEQEQHDKVLTMMKGLKCEGRKVTKELIQSRITSVDYQTIELAGQ